MRRPVYDLSLMFERDMPSYFFWKNFYSPPIFATFTDLQATSLGPETRDGYVTHVSFITHIGTHVDSPRHFQVGKWYIHEIPPDRFLGEGPVISVLKGPGGVITADDLEKSGMEVRPGDIVLLNTGWHKYYIGPGKDAVQAKKYLTEFPGLCRESAEWLVAHGAVNVGIDSPAIDSCVHTVFGDDTWQTHEVLFRENIPATEGLGGDIDAVSGKRCLITCAPVKYLNGDAFPLRVLAQPLE